MNYYYYCPPQRVNNLPDYVPKGPGTTEVVTMYSVLVSKVKKFNVETSTEEIIEVTSLLMERTIRSSCTKPEYANYEYSYFHSQCTCPPEQAPYEQPSPMNANPIFTPSDQHSEMGIPNPPPRSQMYNIMEDTEPHHLLQDQGGYLADGPAPYLRQVINTPNFGVMQDYEAPIVIPMDFLNENLENEDSCLLDHYLHCNC